MVFSSATFVFCFLPITLIIHIILKGQIRNYWLLFASFLFYLWGGISFFPIMLFSICINYVGGMGFDQLDKNKTYSHKY